MAAATPVHRRNSTIVAFVFYLVTLPFLILVAIGNIYKNSILNTIYFFKLNVAQIIPVSVANSNLLNSVARSLGLHDFYTVGLWSYCSGYLDEGVTNCSTPTSFFWFNPIEVLVSELLSGARIALPAEVRTILSLLRLGSRVMYAFFISGTVVNFVLMLLTPLAVRSRIFSLGISLLAFISAILVGVAAIIATVISVAAKIALTAQDELNIRADIGIKMFVFMWIAAVLTFLAFILHAAMGCCCKPNRSSTPMNGSSNGSNGMAEKGRIPLPKFVRHRRRTNADSSAGGTSAD